MTTPNWQHNSGKPPKRKLKPQALRSARERRRHLIKRLLTGQKGRFCRIMELYKTELHGSQAGNQISVSKTPCY